MKKLSLVAGSLLAVLVTGQAVAAADTTGFYVGGALNRVTVDVLDDGETGTGFGVYGGYNFSEFICNWRFRR